MPIVSRSVSRWSPQITRQYDGSIVIMRALRVSALALGVPFFFLSVAVIIFASFLYYLEYEAAGCGEDHIHGCHAAFHSIPHAMWFMLVTMTTVGFGDVSPNTAIRKGITIGAAIFGILFLSMPLGSWFGRRAALSSSSSWSALPPPTRSDRLP